MVSQYKETRYENGPYENGEFHLCVSVCYNDETAVIGGVEQYSSSGVVIIRNAMAPWSGGCLVCYSVLWLS